MQDAILSIRRRDLSEHRSTFRFSPGGCDLSFAKEASSRVEFDHTLTSDKGFISVATATRYQPYFQLVTCLHDLLVFAFYVHLYDLNLIISRDAVEFFRGKPFNHRNERVRKTKGSTRFLSARSHQSLRCCSSVGIGVRVDYERSREPLQLLQQILSHCSLSGSYLLDAVKNPFAVKTIPAPKTLCHGSDLRSGPAVRSY